MDFNYPPEYEFFNIKTGERRTLDARGELAKHRISGFMLSSNLSPNAQQGQDFGWRLAAPTLKIVKAAQRNPLVMREISQAKGINPGAVRLNDLVEFLVDSFNAQKQMQDIQQDENPVFLDEYEKTIKGL